MISSPHLLSGMSSGFPSRSFITWQLHTLNLCSMRRKNYWLVHLLCLSSRSSRKTQKTWNRWTNSSTEPIGWCACATERITPRDDSFFSSHIKDSFKMNKSFKTDPSLFHILDLRWLCSWQLVLVLSLLVFPVFCFSNKISFTRDEQLNIWQNTTQNKNW